MSEMRDLCEHMQPVGEGMLESIRASLRMRLEGNEIGGDRIVMELVDGIVQKALHYKAAAYEKAIEHIGNEAGYFGPRSEGLIEEARDGLDMKEVRKLF